MGSRRRRWVVAAFVVLVGWLAGYPMWHTDPSGHGFRTIPFTVGETVIITSVALVGYVASGLLLRGRLPWHVRLGWAGLVLTTVVVAYALSFVWFGGFCLDPHDVCITSPLSRVAPAVGAFAALAIGALSSEWRRGTSARP